MHLFCPECNSRMVLREGPYGSFYSCILFPVCKGTIRRTEGEKLVGLRNYIDYIEENIIEKNPKAKQIIQRMKNLAKWDSNKEFVLKLQDDLEEVIEKEKEIEIEKILEILEKTREVRNKKIIEVSSNEAKMKERKKSLTVFLNFLPIRNNKEFSKLKDFLFNSKKISWRRLDRFLEKFGLNYIDILEFTNNSILDDIYFYPKINRIIDLFERAKTSVFSEDLKRNFTKQLERAEQLKQDREIDELKFELGMIKFRRGQIQEAIDLLKKVSPSFKWIYYPVPWIPGSSSYDVETLDVQEQIRKTFRKNIIVEN